MFGLALWDTRRRRLVLARDRLGIKPLHYAITADGLFFGSEQKAILASGAVEPQPDIRSLGQLLSYGRIVAPRTMVTGIRRLPAGHTLTWSEGRVDIRQYWEAIFPARDEYDRSGDRAGLGRWIARQAERERQAASAQRRAGGCMAQRRDRFECGHRVDVATGATAGADVHVAIRGSGVRRIAQSERAGRLSGIRPCRSSDRLPPCRHAAAAEGDLARRGYACWAASRSAG